MLNGVYFDKLPYYGVFDMAARKRTVSFTEELDAKMITLCEALGVTPNSYITNAVAKNVLNDSTAYLTQKNGAETMAQMASAFSQLMSEIEKQEKVIAEK